MVMKRYVKLFESFKEGGVKKNFSVKGYGVKGSRLDYEERMRVMQLLDQAFQFGIDDRTRDMIEDMFWDSELEEVDMDRMETDLGYMVDSGDFDHVRTEEDAVEALHSIAKGM
jgi:hypothetical protein